MILLFILAFVSGLVTILAPCIWPLLPIVLSSTLAGKGQKRPLGIALGLSFSFGLFTLVLSSLVRIFHFDPEVIRILAVIVLVVIGLSMLIPKLAQYMEAGISRLSRILGNRQSDNSNGFWGGFLNGASLGVIWSPCAGPILAAIAALAATGGVTGDVVLVTVFYCLGIAIPLFFFAYGGQKFITHTRFLSRYTGRIQQIFGVILLISAVGIYTNYDKIIEANLLNLFPFIGDSLTSFESSNLVTNQLNNLKSHPGSVENSSLSDLGSAPDFVGITKWLNTDKPLTLSDLKGKVVLVDFWTYTCINCIRTLPHVTAWYDKYKNQGFVVIGVHTPEFEIEKNTHNVENAIKEFHIHYPVAQDNNYGTWEAYNNEYWPAEYLIDANGHLRETKFGEGDYDQTEEHIQALLREAGHQVTSSLDHNPDQTPQIQLSPESYLGSARMEFLYPNGQVGNGAHAFSLEHNLPVDHFSYGGSWTIAQQTATAQTGDALDYHFQADKVFLVMHPASQNDTVKVFMDGQSVDSKSAGADVKNGILQLDNDRLYNLIDLKNHPGSHLLHLEFNNSGTQVFAFTFG